MRFSRSMWIGIFLLFYFLGLGYFGWLYFYWGKINTISTILLYLTIGLAVGIFLKTLKAQIISEKTYQDLKVILYTSLICLFVGELGLKYVLKMGLSYGEQNGKTYYTSRYAKPGIKKQFANINQEKTFRTQPPNSQNVLGHKEYQYLHRYNQLGLRERNMDSLNLDTTALKIFCFGDSFTEGVGTHQDSTWCRFLENNLIVQHKNLLVFNAASMGSDPVYEYMKLKNFLLSYQPQIVILTINSTDLGDLYYRGGLERYQPPFIQATPPWWEFLYGSSLIFRNFMHKILGYNGHLLSPQQTQEAFTKSEALLMDVTRQFHQLCREHQIEFILLIRPQLKDIQDGKLPFQGLEAQLTQDSSLHILNLAKVYQEEGFMTAKNAHLFYWPIDRHHNVKGYQIWAKVVEDYLIKNNLLPK